MIGRPSVLLLVCVSALWLIAACDRGAGPSAERSPSYPVTAVEVARGNVQSVLESFGTVELDPEHLHTVTAPRAGQVGRVHVVPGAAVDEGTTLLELRAVPEGSFEAERAQLDYQFAQRDLERVRRLAGLKLATNQEVQSAEKQVETSRAALAALGLLGDGTLPIAALRKRVVSEILVAEGELVQSGQELVRLGTLHAVAVRVGFEVEEMPALAPGLRVLVEPVFGAAAGDSVTARLARLHQIADPATQLVEGMILVPDPPAWAIPGTRVRLRVVLAEAADVLRVPRAALVSQGPKGDAVFVIKGGKARLRPVQVGVRGAQWVEIRSGVTNGEQVVISGRSLLEDGAPVRVTG